MSAWTDKATFCRFLDQAVNNGEMSVVDEIFSPDFIGHFSGVGTAVTGPAGCKLWVQELRVAFPDLNSLVEGNWLIAETSAHEAGKGRSADRIAALLVLRGTHKGIYAGIPASGRRVTFTQVHLLTFKDGRIVQDVVVDDTHSLLRQLGVSSVPAVTLQTLALPELI